MFELQLSSPIEVKGSETLHHLVFQFSLKSFVPVQPLNQKEYYVYILHCNHKTRINLQMFKICVFIHILSFVL